MQARHSEGYQYPNAKPARYTEHRKSAYFTESGIRQLGYIREQLENLSAQAETSDQTKTSIAQIIALIDGLADKGTGSSVSVGNRLRTLDTDLMKIFTVENGAITFKDRALLTAAKIITQGIAAITPNDLSPPKVVLKTLGKNNFQLCETIKSTMNAINAQINFLIQLEQNALASEGLYRLMNNIMDITGSLRSIRFKEGNNTIIIDERLNHGRGGQTSPRAVIEEVKAAIAIMNYLIQQYTNSECTSITLRTMGERRSPIATFDLMLKENRSLSLITQNGHLIGNAQIHPVFMTTTVPFEALKLCASLQGLVASTTKYMEQIEEGAATQETTTRLNAMIASLKAAIERKAGEAKLKDNLNAFRNNFVKKLEEYIETAMAADRKKTVENNMKLSICDWLIKKLNGINLEEHFTPDNQFSQYIAAVAFAYYEHNKHCAETEKSPGKVGEILVSAMNELALLSAKIVGSDSCYYEQNIKTINTLLNPNSEQINPNSEQTSALRS